MAILFKRGNSGHIIWASIITSSRLPVANCSITFTWVVLLTGTLAVGSKSEVSSGVEGIHKSGLLDKESGNKLVAPWMNLMVKLNLVRNSAHLVCLGL